MAKPILSPAAKAAIRAIAVQHPNLQTLRRRNRDSLHFHEMAVWEIQNALEAVYLAGIVDHHRKRS